MPLSIYQEHLYLLPDVPQMNTPGRRSQHLQAGDDEILNQCRNCGGQTISYMLCAHADAIRWIYKSVHQVFSPWSRIQLFVTRDENRIKAGPRCTVLHTLTGFSSDRGLLLGKNYSGREIPIQLLQDNWALHLQLSSHHGSSVADTGEASAKIEKESKPKHKGQPPPPPPPPPPALFLHLPSCAHLLCRAPSSGEINT